MNTNTPRTYTPAELDRIAILTSRLEELLWQKYVEPTLREGKVIPIR